MRDDHLRRGRVGDSPVALFFVLLVAAYLALGIAWTWRAPCGEWENHIFGFSMWQENDPGGWYIPAAHEALSWPRHNGFPGHPGLPLVLLLHLEQAISYGLGRLAHSPLTFTQYTIRHVVGIWLTAKISVVALHLLSFAAVYAYARLVARRRDLALWATAIYATSFPVLYYLNRVSVEPLMNLFFLSTIVCLVKSEKADASATRSAIWASAAGICAASALFTKIHLMAAWPAWAGIGILLGVSGAPRRPLPRRFALLGVFGAAALLAGVIYSQFVDWQAFTWYWHGVQQGGQPAGPASPLEFLQGAARWMAHGSIRAIGRLLATALMPACTRANCCFFFEFLCGLAVLVGLVRGPRSRLLTWSLGYSLLVGAAWLYRADNTDFSGFHYLFPVMATLAPLAAIGLTTLFPGTQDQTRSRLRRGVEICSLLVALHAGGFFAVLDSKRQDAEEYRRSRASHLFAALGQVAPGERIAVLGAAAYSFHGWTDYGVMPGRESVLVRETEGLFLWRRHIVDPTTFAEKAGGRRIALVVDFTRADPGPYATTTWQGLATTVSRPQ
jgi:hypothetical protein